MQPKSDNSFMTTLPRGAVIMWSGTLRELEQLDHWVLCDGNNHTPDLRNRFVVGAGEYYNVGNIGGVNEVVLSIDQMPNHSHNINSGRTSAGAGWSANYDIYTANEGGSQNGTRHVGGSQAHENRPPYFALYYIMKIES